MTVYVKKSRRKLLFFFQPQRKSYCRKPVDPAFLRTLFPCWRLLDQQQTLVPFVMLLQTEKVGRCGRKVG